MRKYSAIFSLAHHHEEEQQGEQLEKRGSQRPHSLIDLPACGLASRRGLGSGPMHNMHDAGTTPIVGARARDRPILLAGIDFMTDLRLHRMPPRHLRTDADVDTILVPIVHAV
jgi:hypothetical protein